MLKPFLAEQGVVVGVEGVRTNAAAGYVDEAEIVGAGTSHLFPLVCLEPVPEQRASLRHARTVECLA
jgi:hypothetical protein